MYFEIHTRFIASFVSYMTVKKNKVLSISFIMNYHKLNFNKVSSIISCCH